MSAEVAAARRPKREAGRRRGLTARPWWPTAKRVLTILFLIAVLALVVNHARTVDWPAVWRAILAYPARTLLAAGGLAALSHALYCCYDLIGRHETGHRLPKLRVAGVGFVSYAFNLNLGALVGGVAMRFRLYARLGLEADVIARVLALSWITNWLGYLLLAGLLFVFAPIALPPDWNLDNTGLRFLGVALLLLAAAYLGLCFGARRREWTVRGHTLRLPAGRIACLQLGVSVANWMLIGGVIWLLLQHHVDYPAVLGVLLIAAVAGVVAHVPAGLGVLEGVFIALLSHRVAQAELIAALLAYRAIYYLAPLALAIVVFLFIDGRARKPSYRPQSEKF